ncbi:MAG: flavin monoamine oxidase family protein [Actinomycetota bacterium]|nr:flavin monoamine oxidase family protein [Actinomycetota bacterium]
MSLQERVDVAVVGAGLAGLVAARRLAQRGVDVAVLEASERVGGRIQNTRISDTEVTEMGGQWVGPTQDRVLALISELGLETFPTRTQGENVIEADGRLRRYHGTIPKLAFRVLADLGIARFKLGRAMRRVDPAAPWKAPRSAELDSITLGDWVGENTRTRTARNLISLSCKTVWGAEPSELSLLWALSYMAAGGGFEKLLDVEGGAQQDRIVGGSALLAERLAAGLSERVTLDFQVRHVRWDGEWVELASEGKGAMKARRVVLAVPPLLLAQFAFQPTLPPSHARLARAWRGGNLIKVTAVYPEPFWRVDGLSGEAVSLAGPVSIAFDNTPASGAPGALVGFVGGSDVPGYAALPAAGRRDVAVGTFARLFGPKALKAEQFHERDWLAEDWAKGGPVSNLGPGALAQDGQALGQSVGPVHFAASEYASRWRGYMDGAVRSGEAAAAAILTEL